MYPTTLSHTIKVVALIQIYYLDLLEWYENFKNNDRGVQ
jgi:hypothetical protein